MSEPTTDAGRALLAVYAHDPQFLADILAIEKEARAQGALHEHLACEGDIERAVTSVLDALAEAIHRLGSHEGRFESCGGYGCLPERIEDYDAVLALIEQHRPKGGPG